MSPPPPAAVGRALPHAWFALPRRLVRPSPLAAPWASPLASFRLPAPGLPAGPAPSQLPRVKDPGPGGSVPSIPHAFSVRPGLPSGWQPPLLRPPTSPTPPLFLSPAPLHSSSHCLPPPPPLPRRPPPPPLPRRGLKEPMGRRRQVSFTCTTWGRGGRGGQVEPHPKTEKLSAIARASPGCSPAQGFFRRRTGS